MSQHFAITGSRASAFFRVTLVAALTLGVAAIRRRDIDAHRAWMTRAYAIAVAAGTQAYAEGVGGAVFGHSPLALDASRGAAWVINLAVAEWSIRRPTAKPAPRRVAATAGMPR